MSEGKWWLVTCTTFGTWLPGDPRGFQTWRGNRYIPPPKRYAKLGEQTYQSKDYANEYEAAKDALTQEPIQFNEDQRRVVVSAIVDEAAETTVIPAIIAVGDVHVHFLGKFGSLRIRPTMGRFKAAATRRLHLGEIDADRIWTRGCHMNSKGTYEEFIAAYRYVNLHEKEGCIVHIWNENIPDDCQFLIPQISIDDLPF